MKLIFYSFIFCINVCTYISDNSQLKTWSQGELKQLSQADINNYTEISRKLKTNNSIENITRNSEKCNNCTNNTSSLVNTVLDQNRINRGDFDRGDTNLTLWQRLMSKFFFTQKYGKICYKRIGCFAGKTDEDGIHYLPDSPQYMDPEFRLYTPNNTIEADILYYDSTKDQLLKTNFNPKYRTVVITHGFHSDLKDYMIAIKDLVFKQNYHDYNVVLVSWGRGADIDSYFQAVANTKVIGALIAYFINRLVNLYCVRNDMFHLIGHSLGAHVVGYAGKRLSNPKLARITGLDPALPGFRGDFQRLDRNDASLVVIIHTDITKEYALTEGLGHPMSTGHIDFYPNGGELQPGCPFSAGLYNLYQAWKADELISCSHLRATQLAYSLGKPGQYCLPVGYLCDNWETFLEGRCADCGPDNSQCYLMGLYFLYWRGIQLTNDYNSKSGQRFYLNTYSEEHYCIYHYQMAFHISNESTLNSGYLGIKIDAIVDKKITFLRIERILSEAKPGFIHTLLVTFRSIIERVFSVSVVSKMSANITKSENISKSNDTSVHSLKINLIEINYMSHIYERERNKRSVILCPESVNASEPRHYTQLDFVPCKHNYTPERLARNMTSSELNAISHYTDILAVDYDMIDIVPHKLKKSHLLKDHF